MTVQTLEIMFVLFAVLYAVWQAAQIFFFAGARRSAASKVSMLYWEKLGVDNLLLIVTGLLNLWLYLAKRREAIRVQGRPYRRLRLELCYSIFFLGYGLTYDLYRVQPLRNFLLLNYRSFVLFRVATLLVLILPIYMELISSIVNVYKSRSLRRRDL